MVTRPDMPQHELLALAKKAKAAHLELCRRDINAFVEYVIKDDETQKPVKQGIIQRKLQALADSFKRVAVMSMPESGKTKNLVIARILWKLGHNPNLRISIICQSANKAKKALASIATHILESKELHEVFPNLKRHPTAAWTNTAITVARTSVANDPSVQAFGQLSDIVGTRIDLLIVDDLLTGTNTATKHLRDKTYNFFFKTLPSRLTKDAQVIILANAWHPDDLVHRLEANERAGNTAWHVERIPVLDEQGNPVWPEQWPLERIEDKRLEIGPLQFAREMLCQARSDGDARFRTEYLELSCRNGAGLPLSLDGLQHIQPPKAAEVEQWSLRVALARYAQTGEWTMPVRIFTGVDLAFGQSRSADESAIVTIAVYPNGLRQVLHVVAGRGWTSTDLREKLEWVYDAFRPTTIMIENNAAQISIVGDLQRETPLPIVGYRTGEAKADPNLGVEGISAAMAMGKWAFPSTDGTMRGILDPEINRLAEECLYYTPEKHTGDRLMAMWFADILARQFVSPRGKLSVMNISNSTPRKPKSVDEAQREEEQATRERKKAATRKAMDDLKAETRLQRMRPWLRG